MELNLTAQNKQEELVLKYLQNNASDVLANKINNGTPFEKDGHSLINKKTLAGFMKYACDEARKLAEKNANSACIDDATVYGWAIHYFEEESIEGTLYTIDGAEYKPTVKRVESNAVKAKPEPKKQENVQFSFFDNLTEQEVKEHETDNSSADTDENEVIEQNGNDEQTPVASNTPNGTFFEKYQTLQQQNPAYVIAYRLGDFYEILGDKAVAIAKRNRSNFDKSRLWIGRTCTYDWIPLSRCRNLLCEDCKNTRFARCRNRRKHKIYFTKRLQKNNSNRL